MSGSWKEALNFYAIILLSLLGKTSSDGLLYKSSESGLTSTIPDELKKTPDFVRSNGYPVEVHEVTTDDGYILTLHRIPNGKNSGVNPGFLRPVVIIQHGIAGTSDNWVLSGPKSFPFLLADNGFDVWLPNTRGNSYSKRHRNLTSSEAKFWDFSFHEQGIYDMASTIDYSLSIAQQTKLFVIGHSRGTTSGLVLLSLKPEYNDKIRLFIGVINPAAYLKHAKSPFLQAFFKNVSPRQAKKMLDAAHFSAFPGLTEANIKMRSKFCGKDSPTFNLCLKALYLFSGYSDRTNKTQAPFYFTHFPDGGGAKELLHYIQVARTDKFAMLDHGARENYVRYGRSNPLEYPLEVITAPMAFTLAPNDYVVSNKDVYKLMKRIRNVVGVFNVPHAAFNHVDVMWGINADQLVYGPTINLMRNF